jgi:predicted CXXCH cytochrome family protein
LAYLLQAVAIASLIAALPASAAAPFSHRTHLKLKLPCTSCHAAASASTRVEDNLLPRPAVCAGCHTDGRGRNVRQQPSRPEISKFSHAWHLKLGNIAPVLAKAIDSGQHLAPSPETRRLLENAAQCTACHRGLEASDTITPAHFPHMADCLVCHNKIELPFSCVTCHGEKAKLRPADHTADFEDRHSSPKMLKVGCAVCHGRTFTCRGCH